MPDTFTFQVSGQCMVVIEGSEINYSPANYDGGSQGAVDIFAALKAATYRKYGAHGRSYRVTTTRAGAECLSDYARVMSEAYLGGVGDDPETRSDGRALRALADRIDALLTVVLP